VYIERAKGAILVDVDGNHIVDLGGGIGVNTIGHANEAVVEAAYEQAQRFTHTFFGVNGYESYIRLCELLAQHTPGDFPKKSVLLNSGAEAVVEGTGDHGCEYMTGGRVVILGETGRNFAAGMSGGIAYVWDATGTFKPRVNKEMVEFEELDESDLAYVKDRIEKHVHHTDSGRGQAILAAWPSEQKRFVKVMPIDYKRALAELRKLAEQDQKDAKQAEVKING
jgi:hypothetical protein